MSLVHMQGPTYRYGSQTGLGLVYSRLGCSPPPFSRTSLLHPDGTASFCRAISAFHGKKSDSKTTNPREGRFVVQESVLGVRQQLEVSTEAEKSVEAAPLATIFGPGHQHV